MLYHNNEIEEIEKVIKNKIDILKRIDNSSDVIYLQGLMEALQIIEKTNVSIEANDKFELKKILKEEEVVMEEEDNDDDDDGCK